MLELGVQAGKEVQESKLSLHALDAAGLHVLLELESEALMDVQEVEWVAFAGQKEEGSDALSLRT